MLILPLGRQGESGIPLLTLLVCLACLGVHLFASSEADKLFLAYFPDRIEPLRMLTSVFVHGDIFHLVGNLFFFYCFARTIECEITVKGYVMAFLLFVVVTNLAYSASSDASVPTIGLSGVVWGFMGMFLMRYPKDNVECFVWYLWIVRRIEVPAFLFVLAFLAFDIGAFRHEEQTGVNYIAHFSGFASGVVLKLGFWSLLETERARAAATVARPSRYAGRRRT